MTEIIEILTLEDPAVAPYRQLTGRQLLGENCFIAESENVILAGLEAGCRPLSLMMERRHITGKGRICRRVGCTGKEEPLWRDCKGN